MLRRSAQSVLPRLYQCAAASQAGLQEAVSSLVHGCGAANGDVNTVYHQIAPFAAIKRCTHLCFWVWFDGDDRGWDNGLNTITSCSKWMVEHVLYYMITYISIIVCFVQHLRRTL